MENYDRIDTARLAIALTATIATIAQPQSASIQYSEIAAKALNTLIESRQFSPQTIQQQVSVSIFTPVQLSFTTNNTNKNNLDLFKILP